MKYLELRIIVNLKLFNFYKSPKKLLAIVCVLLIFVCFVYFIIVPRIINVEKYRVLIINETYKALKLPMEIGKTKANMTWDLGIKIHSDNIVIKHFDNTAYLETGPIDVEISIPYILKRQIRVRRIDIQNAAIDLKRLPNGKYDIEELISPKTKKQVKYKTIFHDTNINVNNYKIIFTDTYITPSPKYLLSGSKFLISDFDPKKLIKVNVDGEIYSENRPSTVFYASYNAKLPLDTKNILKNQMSIKAQVRNFYPDMYSKYLQAYTEEYSYMTGSGSGDLIINMSRKESDVDEIYFDGNVHDFSLYKEEGKNPPAFPGFTNLSFLIQQKSKNVLIKKFSFKNKDIDIKVSGQIKNISSKKPKLNLNFISYNTKIGSILGFLPNQDKHYNRILKKLKKYTINGLISANLNIEGTPKDSNIFGALYLEKFSLKNKSKIINNANARVVFNDKTYNINANAQIDKNEYLRASGVVAPKNNTIDMNFVSNTIKWSSAQRLASTYSDITGLKSDFLKKIHLCGKGDINLNIEGNIKKPNLNGYIFFLNTKIKFSKLPMLISNLTGQIKFNNKNVIFNNVKAKLSQSSIGLNGILSRDSQNNQPIRLNIKGKINSSDIKKYLKSDIAKQIEVKGTFPLIANIRGSTNNWKLSGHLLFNEGDYINYKQDIGLPLDKARIVNFKVSGDRNKIKVDNIELLAASNQSNAAVSINQQTSDFSPLIIAKGVVYDLHSKKFLLNNFKLTINNPLNIQMLNPMLATTTPEQCFAGGTFTGDVQFTGAAAPFAPAGDIVLRNISISSEKITINSASFNLTADKIILTDSDIVIADSQLKVSATADNDMKLPIKINKIEVTSPDLNFDKISSALNGDKLKQNGDKKENSLPVIIQEGNIKAQRFESGKLIGTNLSSDVSLNESQVIELKNISFNAEDGTASGNVKYNMKSTDLEGSLITKNMSSNEIATTLVNLPDEVYGKLDSNSEFKTSGTTKQEILDNTDGKIKFEIRDGHLVRLGSLEYLLLSANTIFAGIANLDLNKIINLITKEKTGYFKTLGGTITLDNGVLHTDDVKSKGKNLSLHLMGSLRMSDDYADMVILGRIKRRTAGKLGPLGSISINSLITDIPVAGFLPGTPGDKGVIDFVPFLDKIPLVGLGGKFAQGRYRYFVVRILGNLYDKESVKSFKWVTRKDLRKYRKSKKLAARGD